jgi:hypothetical protein
MATWKGPLLDPVTIGADGVRRSRSGIVFDNPTYAKAISDLPLGSSVASTAPQSRAVTVTANPFAMNLPGVGGGQKTWNSALQGAINVAADAAAAQNQAIVPPKPTKPKAGKTGGVTTNGNGAKVMPPPVVTGGSDTSGAYDFWSVPSQAEVNAQSDASLAPQIAASRAAQQRAIDTLKAQQTAAAQLVRDFNIAASKYAADATGRAGNAGMLNAAVAALLGNAATNAFQSGSFAPDAQTKSIAGNLTAAGNAQLGSTLAQQENQRAKTAGAVLGMLRGNIPGQVALSQARTAGQQAMSDLGAQNTYGSRVLSGLGIQQGNALNELLGKQADYETKLPGIIQEARSQLMSNLTDAAAKRAAFGLRVQQAQSDAAYKDALLTQAEKRIAISAQNAASKGSLTDKQRIDLNTKIGREAQALATGASRQTTDGNGKVKSVSWSRLPVKDYEAALRQLQKNAPGGTLAEYISALNSYWQTPPGMNGRPYLDVFDRQKLYNMGYTSDENVKQIAQAAFDKNLADQYKAILQGSA